MADKQRRDSGAKPAPRPSATAASTPTENPLGAAASVLGGLFRAGRDVVTSAASAVTGGFASLSLPNIGGELLNKINGQLDGALKGAKNPFEALKGMDKTLQGLKDDAGKALTTEAKAAMMATKLAESGLPLDKAKQVAEEYLKNPKIKPEAFAQKMEGLGIGKAADWAQGGVSALAGSFGAAASGAKTKVEGAAAGADSKIRNFLGIDPNAPAPAPAREP